MLIGMALLVVGLLGLSALRIFGSGQVTGPTSALNELQTFAWPHRFTPAIWRSTPPQRRWQLAVDLTRRDPLRGKSAAWLAEELGVPSETAAIDGGSVSFYDVPAPQRPGDQLIVVVRSGVVSGVYLTPDRMNVPELN